MLKEEFKKIKSTKKDLRNFGLVVGVVLLLIGSFLLWKNRQFYPYFLGTGFFLIITGFIYPSILKPLQIPWMMFSVVIGWLMTRIILTVLFYFVLTPLGIIARISGKRFLDIERKSSMKSYWNYRTHKDTVKENYEKQY